MHEVKLVGILNVTPDSFSDGGLYDTSEKALLRAAELFEEGADIVDVGAESTRPNANSVSEETEWKRLEPVLRPLLDEYPGQISIDTMKPGIVKKAASLGEFIINDVTSFNHKDMVTIAAQTGFQCIVSHIPSMYGQDIQSVHSSPPLTLIEDVYRDLMNRCFALEAAGIKRDKIIADPGIGFGKSPELNWELLEFAHFMISYPVMVGYSRKRFLGNNRLEVEQNLTAALIALDAGAQYLRVHDVAAHRQLLTDLGYTS